MVVRSDITINWNQSPRIITVAAPSTSITVQDLLDTCREAEDDPSNMVYSSIISASGKDDLGGGDLTGITAKLLNALLAFEDRSGPSFVKCFVGAGNLVAVDSSGTAVDPIKNTTYTQVKVTLSVSAALIPGSSGGLTPEQAKQLLLVFINTL